MHPFNEQIKKNSPAKIRPVKIPKTESHGHSPNQPPPGSTPNRTKDTSRTKTAKVLTLAEKIEDSHRSSDAEKLRSENLRPSTTSQPIEHTGHAPGLFQGSHLHRRRHHAVRHRQSLRVGQKLRAGPDNTGSRPPDPAGAAKTASGILLLPRPAIEKHEPQRSHFKQHRV